MNGQSAQVVKGLRQIVTKRRLRGNKAKALLTAADYYHANRERTHYDIYLANGWPIGSSAVEGACRYLVADRMDITGSRWSAKGAEAVLERRAVRANEDFEDYWSFHLRRERQRVHESRYLNAVIPAAA